MNSNWIMQGTCLAACFVLGLGTARKESTDTIRQEERQRGRMPEAALLTTCRGKNEIGGVREEKGEYPISLPFCAAANPLPLSMILFLSLSPYSSVSVAVLRGRTPAAP